MTRINHPEFIKELENTNYPFIPSATLSNGSVTLLEGTFLDAHLYAVTGTFNYYISRVTVTSDKIEIVIGDNDSSEKLFGEVTIPVISDVISLKDEFDRPGGIIVSEISRISLMTSWGLGDHLFEQGQTEFCVTCCMPVPNAGVTGLRLESGEILSGKVWLMGGDGVILKKSQQTNSLGQEEILLEVNVVGDPLSLQKLCNPEELFTPVNAIRKILVTQGGTEYECSPDELGNFNIQMNDSLSPDAALRIRTTPEGIVFNVEGSINRGNNG